MFLGLSPTDALAMYSLITYADLALGMWFPMGGIYALVEDMLALADESCERVLAHNRAPRNCGCLGDATHRGVADNALCGDHLELALQRLTS